MRIVVALGGNALDEPATSRRALRKTASQLADLVADGHELVVTHGNGPQVGELLLDQEARAGHDRPDPLPLDVLVAMTQALLGYRVQQSLEEELRQRDLKRGVVTVLTQVLVDPRDRAFRRPTKPIGPKLAEFPHDGRAYVHLEDGHWRRVVASPPPLEIIEAAALRAVLDDGMIPICGGGGGIPVVRSRGRLKGVEAVIDKDLTSARLAEDLDAAALLILTDVAFVELDHGTPQARPLESLTTADVEALLADGQAPAGSMGPKLRAAATAAAAGRQAVIARLGEAVWALRGDTGTRVVEGGPSLE